MKLFAFVVAGLLAAHGASAAQLDFMDAMQHWWGAVVDGDQPPQPPATVADLATQAPGNVSMLINGVERADLHTIIADPDFKATIFAPTNAAFRAALVKLKLTIVELYADKTALTNILSYHTIHKQALGSGDFKDGQELTTVNGYKLKVHANKVGGVKIEGADDGNVAQVVAADIKAGQSIIHVVDAVLVPPPAPSK